MAWRCAWKQVCVFLVSVLEGIQEFGGSSDYTSLSKNYPFQPQSCVVKGYKERLTQDGEEEIGISVSSFVFWVKFSMIFSMGDRKWIGEKETDEEIRLRGEHSQQRWCPHADSQSAHCVMSLREHPVRMAWFILPALLGFTCKAFWFLAGQRERVWEEESYLALVWTTKLY